MKNRAGENYIAQIAREFRHSNRAQWTARLGSRNYIECGTEKQKGRNIVMRRGGSDTCNQISRSRGEKEEEATSEGIVAKNFPELMS